MSLALSDTNKPNSLTPNATAAALILGLVLATSFMLPLPAADGRILGMPSICPFYEVTGLPCPGCGLTRSFVCFAHGDILAAFRWNLLGPVVWISFALLFVRSLLTIIRRKATFPLSSRAINRLSLGVLTAFLLFDGCRIVWLLTEHRHF